MARDYKRQGGRSRKKTAQQVATPGWVWGLGGLATGLAVAYAVHVYHVGGTPEARPGAAATAAVRAPVSDLEDDEELFEESPFDFYEILPDFTVEVPDEPASKAGAVPAVQPRAVPAGSYWLQAGSFRRHEDADRRKAQLALLGFSSFIQRVAVDDQTWHRVRVGPYDDPAELSQARESLAGHDIKTLRVKVQE